MDVMQDSRIDDHWNVDGSRDMSDCWTGFTQFVLSEEKHPKEHMWSRLTNGRQHPDGFLWSGERLTNVQTTTRPDYVCPRVFRIEKNKNGKRKAKT